MASAAQIEASRRNCQRSNGQKPRRGGRAQGNALKHGLAAVTPMPGLTHEDRDQLRQKTLQLIDELQPSNLKSGGCELKTPRKASNEANSLSTQSTISQWVESEKADPEGRERSQSAAAGQVDCDAGRQDSHRPMEGSTNDAMGISPHEGTDAAVEACPGDGPEQSLDRIEKSRQNASNEANLESTQSAYSKEVGSKKPVKLRPTRFPWDNWSFRQW